jgi:tetratricopeptide (TPR) repeat protein
MNKIFLNVLGVISLAFMTVACSNPAKMAKMASMVTTECSPEVLEAVAGKIDATYSINFPEKFFVKKAVVEITPILVYNGGEVTAPVQLLQGESVLENHKVVAYSKGGKISNSVSFNYVPGMEKAQLELRVKIRDASKANGKTFTIAQPIKIADGTNCTYMLVNTDIVNSANTSNAGVIKKGHTALNIGGPTYVPDNYQDIITEKKEAQIKYIINKSDVRQNQLTSKEIKAFEKFLKEVEKDSKKSLKSNDIVAYASPDGSWERNNELSQDRAKTAKNAFSKTIGKNNDAPVNVSQIAEDWDGFRELVANSNIQDKELILRVLSMYSDPAVREREIKNMSSVFTSLKDKVLPELRRARFIANVEVKNRTDQELLEIVNGGNYDLDEESLLHAATLVQSTDGRIQIYKEAAKTHKSDRAYNNLAVEYLKQGKTSQAKEALSQIAQKDDNYYNNMGIAYLQEKNYETAIQNFSKSNLKEAKVNSGIPYILTGQYQKAVQALNGSNSYNEALANILTHNESKASGILTENSPEQAYLRAIIAARQGNNSKSKTELNKASENSSLAQRSKNDIEFAKL